jgi:hypothetical protein
MGLNGIGEVFQTPCDNFLHVSCTYSDWTRFSSCWRLAREKSLPMIWSWRDRHWSVRVAPVPKHHQGDQERLALRLAEPAQVLGRGLEAK